MDITKVIIAFIVIAVFLYFSYNFLIFDLFLNKLKTIRANEYLKYSSSARAGGSGMVRTPEGGIANAISSDECQRRANIAINIPDSKLKQKVRIVLIGDVILHTCTITAIIIFLCYVDILPKVLIFWDIFV